LSALSIYSIVSELSGVGYTYIILGVGVDKYANNNPIDKLTKKTRKEIYLKKTIYII